MKPFKLERYFAEFEFTAKYLLSSSDCEPLNLSELMDMADKETLSLWNGLNLSYTESQGLPLLREEIAGLYQGISKNQVLLVTPEEGIYITMRSLLQPGDKIICTFPGYQSLYQIAEEIGCQLTFWKPDSHNKFHLSDLKNSLMDDTRMLIINFPHNPTGALLDHESFSELLAMLRSRNTLLFSDEMYRWLEFDDSNRLPSACETYENSITLSGLSKSFSLPGLRLGWLISNNRSKPFDCLEILQSYKDYTTICPPAPSEILALIALRNRHHIFSQNIHTIRTNISLMDEFATKFPHFIEWETPAAGPVTFPRINTKKTTEEFCRCLVDKTGVMLLPGSVYDENSSRVRFGLGRRNFAAGLEKLAQFIH